MICKEKKDIVFINDCNAIVNEKLLRSAICWYSSKPVCKFKHIYMHGNYPAVSIYDKKIHIHRLIKMYLIGTDIEKGFCVHHKDGNKLNATEENLEIVPESEHQSFHNKGKKLSENHKAKISEANKKRKGIKMKKRVSLDRLAEYIKQGLNINEIAKIYNCDWSTVKRRIHENADLLENKDE